MKLTPEQIGSVVNHVNTDAIAENVEEQIERELTDEQYRTVSEAVKDGVREALETLDV